MCVFACVVLATTDAVNVFRLTHIFDNDDENFVFMDMIIACERNV